MEITLYNTTSDKRKVIKDLTLKLTLQCQLFETCDILNPIFILAKNDNIIGCNYLYCARFERYYYIEKIEIIDGARFKISCKVDVLMSNSANIKNLNCTLTRSASNYNLYLDDPKFQSLNYNQIQTKNIATLVFTPDLLSADSKCFVLTVAGGAI